MHKGKRWNLAKRTQNVFKSLQQSTSVINVIVINNITKLLKGTEQVSSHLKLFPTKEIISCIKNELNEKNLNNFNQ